VSASPLARKLNDLPEEAVAQILRMLEAGQPGIAGASDSLSVRALHAAHIIEDAKAGISEFPYRIPGDTWRRLHELRPVLDRLAKEGRLGQQELAGMEATIDARLAAERDEGGVLGWIVGIAVFVLRPLLHSPALILGVLRRNRQRVFIDEGVPMATDLDDAHAKRPAITPRRGPRERL